MSQRSTFWARAVEELERACVAAQECHASVADAHRANAQMWVEMARLDDTAGRQDEIRDRVLPVDWKIVGALHRAGLSVGLIEVARLIGTITYRPGVGWTLPGFRGAVLNKAEQAAFEKVLAELI